MSAPVQPIAMPVLSYGPVVTSSKSPIEFEGITTFSLPPTETYHYSLSLECGKLRISLEDCESKKQWCTKELGIEDYIDPSNSIPDARAPDYVECFHELLAKPSEDGGKSPRELHCNKGDQLQLEIHVKVQALMKSRVVTYSFHLEPVSVERIDVLEAKVRDLQEEVKSLRAAATGKNSTTREMQKTISDLRVEMKLLREAVNPPGIFLARATSQLGVDGVVLWRCEDLKVVDGVVESLSPGVYQVNITVDFDDCRSKKSMQLNKGTKLICSISGSQQLSLASFIHVNKGDKLSVQASGNLLSGYMTLALVARLTV
ncbi:hypothetical protein PHYPSEUDO_010956 [Phytophthora pseudosyringae]|uniref:Uncharacterized protein n=1 Tax=Phytophthora pseudosyringae TaxID=221518 RepID=A0A8T1WAA0_9STRA|nr:hypothetical protein PHYPSEUDO_010956 [Phytophthora pseudosyringae]